MVRGCLLMVGLAWASWAALGCSAAPAVVPPTPDLPAFGAVGERAGTMPAKRPYCLGAGDLLGCELYRYWLESYDRGSGGQAPAEAD